MVKRGFFLFRKNRSGAVVNLVLMRLFYVLLGTFVGLSLLGVINSYKNNTAFEKSYLSKDISFLANVIYFASGDLEFEYNQDKIDLDNFIFDFKDGIISVSGASNRGGRGKKSYRYAVDTRIDLYPSPLKSPYSLDFGKDGKSVFIGKKAKSRNPLDCSRLDTTKSSWAGGKC